jgi:hypothetical protein
MVDGAREVLGVVEAAVRAVADRDLDALTELTAPGLDLYEWTRGYGEYGDVMLLMPPGPASLWDIDWLDMDDGDKHVVVAMWTRQEGRSDLSLELKLHATATGQWRAEIIGLHVL